MDVDLKKRKERKKSDIPASSRPKQMTSSESESKGNCELLNSAFIFNKAKTHKTLVVSLGSAGLPLYFLPPTRLWSVCAAVQRRKLPLIPNSLISRSLQLFGGLRTETWHFLRRCKSEKFFVCFFNSVYALLPLIRVSWKCYNSSTSQHVFLLWFCFYIKRNNEANVLIGLLSHCFIMKLILKGQRI